MFQSPTQEIDIEFAEKFTKLNGKFSFCLNHHELVQQLNALITKEQWTKVICNETKLQQILETNHFSKFSNDVSLANCDVSITTCEALVARTGSILLSSNTESGRSYSVYAPIHICIAYTKQVVYDISDAMTSLQKKYKNNLPSVLSLATGPSRTADIEKTLVVGVHGPKEVYCFLVDE